ncbi:hypothetical protein GMORB2_7549 [Geosmithia morbida]|uniref:Uncharacterized protein n=1 Tax=Geosmithia morbida TaxID=1094350 RepID=A0A9P4YRU3_9HYPO|nr:uncharacterized protein GMORB2_7549 [Geosmithia morbida]KAF4121956.1 hypothetical protein GMORB2_7549 [Geosmithia morbida]
MLLLLLLLLLRLLLLFLLPPVLIADRIGCSSSSPASRPRSSPPC